MTFLTSDIHGRSDELLALLKRAGFFDDPKNKLYVLGDVVDRNGDGGVEMLEWIMSNPNIELILGNHEKMMLDSRWAFAGVDGVNINSGMISVLQTWKRNGGVVTVESLKKRTPEQRAAIFDYLAECPLYKEVEVGGARYVLVHGGLGDFDSAKELAEYSEHDLLWTRPSLNTVYDPEHYTVVIGHTPTHFYDRCFRGRILKSQGGWWNIDTGAAGDGTPMLLCLDTLTEYYTEGECSQLT